MATALSLRLADLLGVDRRGHRAFVSSPFSTKSLSLRDAEDDEGRRQRKRGKRHVPLIAYRQRSRNPNDALLLNYFPFLGSHMRVFSRRKRRRD